MRIIVERVTQRLLAPLLRLSIHDAPHRRMHIKVIQRYRDELRKAFHAAEILTPIDYPVELSVLFVNPCSPDLDNLLTALYQAMDGATLKPPGILVDDRLVQVIRHLSTLNI